MNGRAVRIGWRGWRNSLAAPVLGMQVLAMQVLAMPVLGIGVLGMASAPGRCLLGQVPEPMVPLQSGSQSRQGVGESPQPATPIAFDGERSYEVLKQIVELGPRISASKAMKEQQELLTKHFEALGAKVFLHKFKYAPPSKGRQYAIANLIVTWNPAARRRILLCTHYDTRPYADQDPRNPRAKLPGANDGASGVALLHELGRHMGALQSGSIGVDFVFFDAEEFVFNNRQNAGDQADPLFVGSTQFANDYKNGVAAGNLGYVYECGVLLDMIGDAQLELYWEKHSMSYPVAREVAREIWAIGQELGFKEFHAEIRHEVRDDHLPLNAVANIPTIDLIDFDYPTVQRSNEYWHTQQDTPDKCSARSLEIVGTVMLEWLKRRVQP